MSKNQPRKIGECVYCGRITYITEDHIPPISLFSKPRPNNLVKVPSCKDCHSENPQVSLDDEYFRLMLTLREDTANHPDVVKILPTVLRSLAKPEKEGFKNNLLRGFKEVNVRTHSGLYLGIKPSYDVKLDRLDNVAKRITKGLFYHETGHRLPDTYDTVSYAEAGMQKVSEDVIRDLQNKIIRPLLTMDPKKIGNKVLLYRVLYSNDDPNSSVWLFTFYERVSFLCMTLSKDDMVRQIGNN